jgi:hypothetical protein
VEPRILIVLKCREQQDTPSPYSYSSRESGLMNSARFVKTMLDEAGLVTKMVEVVDNNCIDREVTLFKPTHVIIEALWVVPSKFEVLTALHPNVQWIIRAHSELPFIANEGIAVGWIRGYLQFPNVSIAANAIDALTDFRTIARATEGFDPETADARVIYLPNYYPFTRGALRIFRDAHKHEVHVGCFGALRPLKNQLIQAVAAIRYAEITGKRLAFHINASRPEQGGNENLKNIRALFENTKHALVEHEWMKHHDFLHLIAQMDLVMQVSMTETFCIVAADAVTMNVPVVVSPEIDWVSESAMAEATDAEDIAYTIGRVLDSKERKRIHQENREGLAEYCADSRWWWLEHFLCSSRSCNC